MSEAMHFQKIRKKTTGLTGTLPILLPILLVLVMTVVLIVPKARELSRTKQAVRQLSRNLQSSSHNMEILSRQSLQDLILNLEEIETRLPDRESFYTYLNDVKKIGVSSGITRITYYKEAPRKLAAEEILSRSEISILPGLEGNGNLKLKGIPVRFQFHCTYRNLYSFLKGVRQNHRLADIQGIEIKKLPESLVVDLKTMIYFLSPETEDGDAA
jgi:Tfp pilus assembly protein PilO